MTAPSRGLASLLLALSALGCQEAPESTPEATRNPCGGTEPLPNELGAPCGTCGGYVCDGHEAVMCGNDHAQNDCGGCASLAHPLGDACGAGGTYVCSGTDQVQCLVPPDCDSLCKAQSFASGACALPSSNTNLGVVPDDWGDYDLFGDVCYGDPNVSPQITHVDPDVRHDDHVSIRIDHHVDGVDPNGAREADGHWLAVAPDDRVLFSCWIRTSPAADGTPPDLGYAWGSGGRLGIDFYDEHYIGGVSYDPQGGYPTEIPDISAESCRANYVLWGSDWTHRTIDLLVPPTARSDGYYYPKYEQRAPSGIIPWLQAWGNEPETGIAWFADCELYINPVPSGCPLGETALGPDGCASGTCCCS